MTLFKRQHVRYMFTALLLAVSVLVPLKTLFACSMMGTVSEKCCCKNHCADDCLSQDSDKHTCCDLTYLPEAGFHNSATVEHSAGYSQLNSIELPPAFIPLETGPDPPKLLVTTHIFPSTPPPWFSGTELYLTTERLRI